MASRVVDTDYELFWREVAEAVKQIELNHGLEFTIERGNKAAKIWHEKQFATPTDVVQILVYEVEPKQPTLLVP